MLLLIILFIIFLIFLWSWIYFYQDAKRMNAPGPFPLPLLGNGLALSGDITELLPTFSKLAVKYNDAFQLHIFTDRFLILSHPKYMEDILTSTEHIHKGATYDFLLPWLGRGLLTAYGNKWKAHRRFLTPAFHFNILQSFLPVMLKNQRILNEKLRTLADGQPIDLAPIITLAALDIISESIMGVTINAQKKNESEYVQAILAISEIIMLRMQNPFYGIDFVFNLTSHKKVHDDAVSVLHRQSRSVIQQRRLELEASDSSNKEKDESDLGIKSKHAFLDLLLLAEIDGKKIDDEVIREEVDTFLFEGHDTTTSGILFALYNLSKHKDVQDKVYEELTSILGEDPNREPTFKELQQLKYLECVIKESLRIHPPVPLIERKLMENARIGGIDVPKNTSVMLNFFHMHRHPDVFENPLEFHPERFEKTLTSPFYWLPFSAGSRNCIGQKFAILEMKEVISSIIRNFEVLPTSTEPELFADLVLRSKNGIIVKLLPRSP